MVNNNETEYFPQGPNWENDRRAKLKPQDNYKEILRMFLVE